MLSCAPTTGSPVSLSVTRPNTAPTGMGLAAADPSPPPGRGGAAPAGAAAGSMIATRMPPRGTTRMSQILRVVVEFFGRRRFFNPFVLKRHQPRRGGAGSVTAEHTARLAGAQYACGRADCGDELHGRCASATLRAAVLIRPT